MAKPIYTVKEILLIISLIETTEDLHALSAVIRDDLKKYTLDENMQILTTLAKKVREKIINKFKKEE